MNLKKSLKPIKKAFDNKNRAFVTIRRVYTHLCDLSNEEILDYYNVHNIKELEEHIEYIKDILLKQNRDDKSKLEEIDSCFCLDSRGDFKYLYTTQKEAQKQIDYTLQTKRIKLKIYACPYHCGWHISKC